MVTTANYQLGSVISIVDDAVSTIRGFHQVNRIHGVCNKMENKLRKLWKVISKCREIPHCELPVALTATYLCDYLELGELVQHR